MQFIKIILITFLFSTAGLSEDGRLESDFYGYTQFEYIEEIEEKEDKAEERKDVVVTAEYLDTLTAKEIRELKDELKDVAVIKPTEQNIKNYLVMQKFISDKSEDFMNKVQIVTKDNQDLDIAIDVQKSKYSRQIKALEKKEQLKAFYEKNIDKFVLVVFFDTKEDIYNRSVETIMQYISQDMPIEIRYIDINSPFGVEFKKEKQILHTPDLWMSFKNADRFIWERLYTGIPTKNKVYQMIDFVFENQIKPQLSESKNEK